MKLEKAITPIINYPRRKYIKPIILSATVAMALTACVPQTTGETAKNNPDPYISNASNTEIKYPENIAGGIPVFIPEQTQENNNTWNVNRKK